MRRALLIAILLLLLAPAALAQGDITVTQNTYQADFPLKIVFRLAASSSSPINQVTLRYRIVGDVASNKVPIADLSPGPAITAEWTWDMRKAYYPPGIEVEYWWETQNEAGSELKTEHVTFVYEDSRYTWSHLSQDNLHLYWYRGGQELGQELFDQMVSAAAKLQQDVGLTALKPIKIYVYGSYEDLHGALEEQAKEWTGGVSFSKRGLILIGISPSNKDWGKRAIAHELSHSIVHQATDNPLGGLPTWLDEGLAMYAEGPMEPEYKAVLDEAIRNNQLISLRALSASFPTDPGQAHLSYAESISVFSFMLERYGKDKVSQLLLVFKRGVHYDDALQEVLGVNTEGLEAQWHQWLGVSVSATPVSGQTPGVPVHTPGPGDSGSSARCLCCGAPVGLVALGALALALLLARGLLVASAA
ncbi:MAG: hypothetical protein KKA73_17100 [Chloroflexi bacterium]|nr:hypothetical protein [Chloroflexota bacterium]MBU1749405.1 hypothetical protein [Chloroflexota bacterium]MBU1879768.1 hypothetical protein [Chloroflexota bacterium]